MVYIIFLFSFIVVLSANEPALALKYDNTQKLNKEFTISKKDYNKIKNKSDYELMAVEAYMMGLWYFDGKKELGIKKNLRLSNKYLKLSFDKGYAFASVHYINTLLKLNYKDNALTFLNELLNNNDIDNKVKIINLQMIINYFLQQGDTNMAVVYVRYASDKLNYSRAKIQLALMYYEGVYIKQDKQLASYYLNSGCNMKNLDDFSSSICNMFKKE